jgi:hypothetical protein
MRRESDHRGAELASLVTGGSLYCVLAGSHPKLKPLAVRAQVVVPTIVSPELSATRKARSFRLHHQVSTKRFTTSAKGA